MDVTKNVENIIENVVSKMSVNYKMWNILFGKADYCIVDSIISLLSIEKASNCYVTNMLPLSNLFILIGQT